MQIIPSVLTNNTEEAIKLINIAQSNQIKRVQIDIVDGVFAKNKTIYPEVLASLEDLSLSLDIHLMVKNPQAWIKKSMQIANSDRIIGQIEFMYNQNEFIQEILTGNIDAGLAVDLKTPINDLDSKAIRACSVILLMSVPAGFGGQSFDKSVYQKIEKLQDIRRLFKSNFKICIDGGVKTEILSELESFGVDEVVQGKSWFEKII